MKQLTRLITIKLFFKNYEACSTNSKQKKKKKQQQQHRFVGKK